MLIKYLKTIKEKENKVTTILITIILVLLEHNSTAQITVVLEKGQYHMVTQRPYNLALAEISCVISGDTFFLPKISPYEFILTNDMLHKVQISKDSFFQIIVENSNYLLKFYLENSKINDYNPKLYLYFFYITDYKLSNAIISGEERVMRILLATEVKKKRKDKKEYR